MYLYIIGGQKRILNPLELEEQQVDVSYYVGFKLRGSTQ